MPRRTLVLVVALLLAGCASSDDPEEDPAEPMAVPTSLTYGDCDELLGVFPVQSDAIALPEGFTPAPLAGQGTGTIFVVAWECAIANDSEGRVEEIDSTFTEVFMAFSVTPPPELAMENAFAHGVLVGLGTESLLGMAAYGAWNVTGSVGDIDFGWQAAPIGGGTGTVVGAAGPIDIDLRVNAGGPPATDAASSVRTFVIDGDAVVAAYDIAWVEAGGFQGQAISTAAVPGAPPATTGLGFYYTSDEPVRYTMTPFALPNATASG